LPGRVVNVVAVRAAGAVLAVVLLVVLGACSGGGGHPSPQLSVADLSAADDTCPLDVAAAVRAAGLRPAPGRTEVTVVGPRGDTGSNASALERAGAVQVACDQPSGDADVTVWIIASQRPEAFDIVLPALQRSSGLETDEMYDLPGRARDTDEGELVDLGDDARAAVARIDIRGAASGVLYVEAAAASPEQVHDIAEHLVSET
jgi:hypothetical protein